jgi:hypothetical protein
LESTKNVHFPFSAGLSKLILAVFAKGAILAQDPANYENVTEISEAERDDIRREYTNR